MSTNKRNQLVELVGGLKTPEEVKDFLEGFLTPHELKQVENRVQIIKKLKNGQAQHLIAEDLELGVATVTRGSRELGKGRFWYVK